MISAEFPDWDVSSYEVFNKTIIEQIDQYRNVVSMADIIISQPIHDGYRSREDLSLNWIRSTAKPHAALVVFPSMHFEGQLVGWRSVSIPGYGMPYHDMLLFHLAAMGLSTTRIAAILLDNDLYSDPFIAQEIALSVSVAQRREAVDLIDVPISPFLEEYGQRTQLFHIINHPCRPALAFVANAVLRRLGYNSKVATSGRGYLPFPKVPLSPSVNLFLRRRNTHPKGWPTQDEERFHLPKAILTREEYYTRAVDDLKRFTPAELTACLKDHRSHAFLSRVATANPNLPDMHMYK
jgi:hypothetical protein